MKINPTGAAILCLFLGGALAVAGVHLLAGRGWACIAASVPLFLLGLILTRGIVRAE